MPELKPEVTLQALVNRLRGALALAMELEHFGAAAHLCTALVELVGVPLEPISGALTEQTVRVPMIGQTRDETPRKLHAVCRCPQIESDAGMVRVGYAAGCPAHRAGAPGSAEAPTERFPRPPSSY